MLNVPDMFSSPAEFLNLMNGKSPEIPVTPPKRELQ